MQYILRFSDADGFSNMRYRQLQQVLGFVILSGTENVMPLLRTYAEPVEDTVTVRIPKEYTSYSFQVILVPCNERPSAKPSNDIHIFDSLHSDWGGSGNADEIAAALRRSRNVDRVAPTW